MKIFQSNINGVPVRKLGKGGTPIERVLNPLKQKFILLLILCFSMSTAVLTAQSFGTSNLNFNGNDGVESGTSLMFGPDGRLYVLSLNGTIDIYTVQRNGVDNYIVTASEELFDVKNIPNHNDDGSSNSGNNREATGITVAGTAANPEIYVTSSDSRVGGPSGDQNLDTNSGVITRLTWNGGSWDVVDLVRGLPRSEENHATNGLEFVTIGGTDFLIVSSGGHANAGSPSDNFAWTTEYALSAAVLSVNLTMLEGMTIQNDGGRQYIYDIPTLDDPTRANANGIVDPDVTGYNGIDLNDPWGGNDGLNQAMLVPGGPVQIFSPGYRNSYDLTVTQDGKVFITDNGANGGWGGFPENEGLVDGLGNSLATNNYIPGEPGSSSSIGGEQVDNVDHLSMATDNIQTYSFGSFYGGHPVPVRANPVGAGLYTNPSVNNTTGAVFRTQIYDPDGSTPGSTTDPNLGLPANWPPVPVALADARQGDWRGPTVTNPDGPDDVLVTTWGNNTNGIDEYTASNFAGAMQGDLIAGKNGGVLRRVQLNPDGSLNNLTNTFASNLGGNALGITCNSDSDPFPGTIWVATFNSNIVVLEPQDFVVCILPGDPGYDPNADNDSDGYTNQDEIDNKDPSETIEDVICNGSNQPDDFDKSAGGSLVSDLNDADDDSDGILDANDPFQLGDPTTTGNDAFDLPVMNDLFSDNPELKGYFGLGFTGLMNNGDANPNYLNWLDEIDAGPNPNDLLGGAVGAMTLQMTEGTADGGNNDQEKGYQFGVNVDQSTAAFVVEGRLFNFSDPLQLYGSSAPANGELGFFIGDGTQSNFIKFILTQNGLEAIQELGDSPQSGTALSLPITVPNRPTNDVVMRFEVNTVSGVITLSYSFDSAAFLTLGTITAGGAVLNAIQNSSNPLAVGLTGSSKTSGVELEGTWDYLNVSGAQPIIEQVLPALSRFVGDGNEDIDLNDFFDDDNGDGNLTYTVENNSDPAIGANISGNFLTLTYPGTPANTNITIRATDGDNLFVEQTFNVDVTDQPVSLYRVNSNGPQYTDSNTEVWEADNYFNGGSVFEKAGQAIANTTDDTLYQTERYGNFSYDFPTGNGDYIVELHFAEIYFGLPGGGSGGGVGSRVFNVNIESGPEELTNYDIFADVGAGAAVVKTFPVTVTDGTLNIVFTTVTNNAKISAIAILNQTGGGTPITITSTVPDQNNAAGETLDGSLVVEATGGDGNLQFSATGLPPNIFIEPTNGNIFGTIDSGADTNSPYLVTITVDDSDANPNDTVSFNFTWTVGPANTTDQWFDQTDDENYTARHECSFVQAGDKFYLFGGRENSSSLDVYNYQNKTWSTISNSAPSEFNHFQALEHEGLIWVIGAFKTNAFPNELPADFVWAYNPVLDTWIQGPAIPASRKRGSAGLVVYNNKFYIIAGNTIGHNGGYIPWFDEFDPATGTWTQLTDAPRARDHFHAAVIGDKLYVAGGRLSGGPDGTFEPLIAEVDVYDFTAGSWSTLPTAQDIPTPRAAASVAVLGNELYVIGGEIQNDLQGNLINDAVKTTEAFNPATGTWSTKADLIIERHGTQAIVSGSGIHVAAGSNTKGGGGTMKNMEYYGTDNPTGTPLIASQLSVASAVTIPTGSGLNIPVSNSSGNVGIIITDAQLSGPNAGAFNVVTDPSFLLINPSGSTNIGVNHTGVSDGDTATLTIAYDDGSTSVVSLVSGVASATVLYRVNNGGPLVAATDAPNPDWSVDQGTFGDPGNSSFLVSSTTPGGVYDQTNGSAYAGPIDLSHPSIPSGTPASIFQTERFDAAAAPEMVWAFPVTPGSEIEVRLYFAEIFTGVTGNGQRVFDVSVEGVVPAAFDNIDPYAAGGGELVATMVTHTLTVNDNSLDIVFVHGVENPALKAIEILEVSGSGPLNTAPVVTNPGTQQSVEGDAINLPIVATDEDPCTNLTYSAQGLPPTLNIDPATGLITGTLDVGSGSGVAGAYIESGGIVMIEAENDFQDTAGGWDPVSESGTDFLVATTNHFGNTNGQTLSYDINITTPGVYRFHMKSNISGTNTTEENDTWFKIDNTSDVHFFCIEGGSLTGTSEFENILGGGTTSKTVYYPAGNALGRPDHGNENPGNSGFFKVFRSGGGGNKWSTLTIDNNSFPIYAYFPNAGNFTISMSERSAGHKVDRFALIHIDDVATGVPFTTLNSSPQSDQATGGTPGAADNSPYNVTVSVADGCDPSLSTDVNFVWNVTDTAASGTPSALVEITPDGGLGASTFGGSSIQITNTSTGTVQISSISIDLSTGIHPDNVFDPVGAGGDATASCFTPNSGGAAVGLIAPADPCVDPFSAPRNGGYDVMGINFADFDPAEQFFFTVDVDPNSIQGVPGAGGAGAVSGMELIGATITMTFTDGSTLVSSLYEDGSLGGGQAVVAENALPAPTIAAVGIAEAESCVDAAAQTIEVTGTPGANVSLILIDSRLYIQSGAPPFNVPDPYFYANEAMAKALYTAVIEPDGNVEIPVTLLETTGDPAGSPDGGLNYIMAVVSNTPYAVDQQVSMTSNLLVLKVDPPCAGTTAEININATLQSNSDHSGDYAVKLYDVGSTTAVYDLTATADAAGNMTVADIAPGTYQLAVKYPNSLQAVQTVTLAAGANPVSMGELAMGDVDNNNFIDVLDLSIFGVTYDLGSGDTGFDSRADFNKDGIIDILDFSLLGANYDTGGDEPSGP